MRSDLDKRKPDKSPEFHEERTAPPDTSLPALIDMWRSHKGSKMRTSWDLAPSEEVHEYICNENEKDVRHLK